jgi:hypothetical protein
MPPRKSKTSTKERICSDPFIVDDDDSVEGSNDDDYEESVLLFMFDKYSVLTTFSYPVKSQLEMILIRVWRKKRKYYPCISV